MNTFSEQPSTKPGRKSTLLWLSIGIIAVGFAATIGISDNFPGILLLLFGSFSIVYSLVQRVGSAKNLKPGQRLLYWAPRILSIVFIGFVSIFATDVFGESRGLWETILAFLIHLIPVFVMIGVLVLSWRWEWIGGIIYLALAFSYIIAQWGKFPLMTYLLISGPLALMGILFIINWQKRMELRGDLHP